MTTMKGWLFALLVSLGLSIGFGLAVGAVLADDDPLVPGRAHFDAQRFDEAKAVFTTVLADDDQNHEAWAYLGRIALHGEDADTAVKCLAAAVELRDDDSRYQTWLAQAYLLKLREVPFMEKGRYSQLMIKHLNRAIELDGENIEARATLAGFYAQAPAIAAAASTRPASRSRSSRQSTRTVGLRSRKRCCRPRKSKIARQRPDGRHVLTRSSMLCTMSAIGLSKTPASPSR